MKKLFTILPLCATLGLTACQSLETFLNTPLNPLDYIQNTFKTNYVNRDLRKLKGRHIQEVIRRGVPIAKIEPQDRQTKVYLNYWGVDLGSGTRTTTTTTTYYNGYAIGQTQNEHIDSNLRYAMNYFLVDENGIIVDYVEIGNAIPKLPDELMARLRDLM